MINKRHWEYIGSLEETLTQIEELIKEHEQDPLFKNHRWFFDRVKQLMILGGKQ